MMILLVHVCYISFLDNTVWLRMFPQFRLVGSTLIVGLFNFSDIGILVQMTLFCASKAVQQHQCLLPNRRQLDLASCDGPKCCQTSPHVHWTFNWEMKLPLIESQFLSGFIAMNHLEKKKKLLHIWSSFHHMFLCILCCQSHSFNNICRALRVCRLRCGGWTVTGGDELFMCQIHVPTHRNICVCMHVLFIDCLNAILNFFFSVQVWH